MSAQALAAAMFAFTICRLTTELTRTAAREHKPRASVKRFRVERIVRPQTWRAKLLKPRFNPLREKSAEAFFWRLVFGPALLIEGVLMTVTLGTFSISAPLEVARRLSMSRMRSSSQ